MMKNRIPDMLTLSRIPLALALLFIAPLTAMFYAVYALSGLTDMLDGPLARKMGVSGPRGARLDTVSDTVFAICAAIRILPEVYPGIWLMVWILAIIAIKLVSALIHLHNTGHFIAHHSYINKAAGFFIFVFPFALPFVPAAHALCALSALATIAALEELASTLRIR